MGFMEIKLEATIYSYPDFSVNMLLFMQNISILFRNLRHSGVDKSTCTFLGVFIIRTIVSWRLY